MSETSLDTVARRDLPEMSFEQKGNNGWLLAVPEEQAGRKKSKSTKF